MKNDQKKQQLENILAMAKALLSSMDTVIKSVPKSDNLWHFASYRSYAEQYNALVSRMFELEPKTTNLFAYYNMDNIRGNTDTLPLQQHSIFQDVHGNLSMLCAWIDSELGSERITSEVRTLENFLQASLRPAMLSGKPNTEKDVQDTIERILIGRGMQKGMDYDRETGRVKFSVKESVPDFVFRTLSTALEVKLLKDSANLARLVDEINADIVSYGKGYNYLIFLIYDIGSIADITQFKRDIESAGNIKVVVVKH
ncbi:MAG: hypothetical protein OXU23_25600 [Candidatus Poribacteria bacterium]|nr:hypothetical protein [Candidatus Poribacteria bacterium]